MREKYNQFSDVVFFRPTEFEKSGGFWPIRIGRCEVKPHFHEGPKYVNHYSLHFVLEGSGTFLQGNRVLTLGKGDLFCLFPNISLQYSTSKDNLLQLVWIAFNGKQALSLLDRFGLRPNSPHLPAYMNNEAVNRLEQVMLVFKQPGNSTRDILRHSVFFKLFDDLLALHPSDARIHRNDPSPWLDKGLDYMKMHCTEGITVEEVAKYVGIDRSYFSKRFQKKFKVTPGEYLKSLVMREAEQLVKNTDYSFGEIAYTVGFSTLYSFSKAYKKYYGVSPTESRISHAKSGLLSPT
jgi:AraC-like DNA-binding protein